MNAHHSVYGSIFGCSGAQRCAVYHVENPSDRPEESGNVILDIIFNDARTQAKEYP
ncbi:MAG: hypothetical protein AABX12_00880 [Nanoarchaeota archaeon]